MKIGIGLPTTIAGATPELLMEWTRKIEAGPFSTIGLIDRVVYHNYEPMTTLATVAGATQRVGLMTTVLVAPLRSPALLAKEAATLDALSGGRFTLGMGIGARPDDFQAVPAHFKNRARRFERQLEQMKRIWSGQAPGEGVGPIGPKPARAGGPEVLIGGRSPDAIRRVGRWGDGFLSSGGDPESVRSLFRVAEEAWQAEGRSGKPRLVGAGYFALGPGNSGPGADSIRHYYSFAGDFAERLAQSLLSTPQQVRDLILGYESIGMDELILWPTVLNSDQPDRLAELVA